MVRFRAPLQRRAVVQHERDPLIGRNRSSTTMAANLAVLGGTTAANGSVASAGDHRFRVWRCGYPPVRRRPQLVRPAGSPRWSSQARGSAITVILMSPSSQASARCHLSIGEPCRSACRRPTWSSQCLEFGNLHRGGHCPITALANTTTRNLWLLFAGAVIVTATASPSSTTARQESYLGRLVRAVRGAGRLRPGQARRAARGKRHAGISALGVCHRRRSSSPSA